MFHRPLTLATIVVVMFALGGLVRLMARGATASRSAHDPDRYRGALSEELSTSEPKVGHAPETSTLEDERVQTPRKATVDPLTIRRMQDTIDALEKLIEEGRQQCAELGEPNDDPEYPGAAGMAHAAAWSDFAREWDYALNNAVERLPAHPGWQVDEGITYAYQDISSAVGQLRIVPVGVGDWSAPFEYQWTERFDSAQLSLESARERLSPEK